MKIEEQKQGAVTVLRPIGPLTAEAAVDMRGQLSGINQRTMGRFVIDAGAISFVDSAGLEVLLDTTDQLIAGGRVLKMCGANDTLREVLELTGLTASFEYYDDVNSAVRSFL
jgi:anti-anti-sigma factor